MKKPAAPPSRTKTVAYLRVSTDKQADLGISLEVQRTKVEQYAKLFDLDLVAIEEDAGESAKSLNRPALARALAMLRDGRATALLIVKLDRLTRSVRDLCDLVDDYFREGDCALVSVTEQLDTRSAMGRGVLKIFTTLGEIEREQIGERTLAAMAHLKSQGKKTGGDVPYGYELASDGKTLRKLKGEQLVIEKIKILKKDGLGLRAIARALADRGVRARSGRPFHHAQIARILA